VLTADNTYTCGTTISAGTLQLGNGGTTGSVVGDIVDNGTLAFNRSNTYVFTGQISGPGTVTQAGPGTTVLTAGGTYTGATLVAGGVLRAGAINAFSPASAFFVNPGTTLDLNNFNNTIGSLSGLGAVTLGTGILTTGGDNSSTIFGGTMSGGGGLIKTGTGMMIFDGTGTYTGLTTACS
jgi:fibronectin-binding autotransporter adhesin